MFLAERSRPFYGPAYKTPKIITPVPKTPLVPRKRKIKEDLTVPLNVKLNPYREPDLNTTYDAIHTPLKQGRYENAFKEFIRRGKESLFDEYYEYLQRVLSKMAEIISSCTSEDILIRHKKNYNTMPTMQTPNAGGHRLTGAHRSLPAAAPLPRRCIRGPVHLIIRNSTSPVKPVITLHTPWCLVCGKGERLRECPNCPSAFHLACRREWLVTVILTDHASIVLNLCQSRQREDRVDFLTKVNYDAVIKHLETVDFSFLDHDIEANEAATLFVGKITTAIEAAPFDTIQ
ncbi:hypothetical protein B5X24_HaOG207387 [Helicoverpa armigera]|uniref:Uncharacterized protein n=1 Tax=Helicoverpa armigera TaxID=29058 RepID=A0A2W1BII5_HELAM|nr:hypothetical protein B5X24_HaOG207387 [Helicoverpa armigera]